MGTFDHSGLMHAINDSLAPFRKAQPEAFTVWEKLHPVAK